MKRFLLCAILAVVTPLAFGHVGSPNVFFEGRAGVYSVYAVVRPPAALPGAAQVSVRVLEADIRSVSLLPVMWQAGRKGSPVPVVAQRVTGETNLWSAEVWFLRPGSYTIQVNVEGSRGSGEAIVPVNAIGMQGQPMKPGLRATLSVLGLLLVASAVFIVGAVAREGCLEPGDKPAARHYTRGRWSAAIAVLLLAAGGTAGAARWRSMDLAYRTQGVQKPEPAAAAVRADDGRVILELRQSEQSASLPSWAALVPDHGKLMHLFLIREPALDVFAHLHPIRTDARTFALEAPALPAGGYQLYGDVTFENGISQTLVARVTLPETFGATPAPPPLATNLTGEVICGFPSASGTNNGPVIRDMDDSWHVGQAKPTGFVNRATVKCPRGGSASRLMGGHTLLFENADAVMAGSFWAVTVAGQDLAKYVLLRDGVSAAQATERAKFAYGFVQTLGGGLGLLAFGPMCVRLGRKKTFALLLIGAFLIVPITCYVPKTYGQLLLLLPVFGFLTLGLHAGFAIYFPELFPTHLRATRPRSPVRSPRNLCVTLMRTSSAATRSFSTSSPDRTPRTICASSNAKSVRCKNSSEPERCN